MKRFLRQVFLPILVVLAGCHRRNLLVAEDETHEAVWDQCHGCDRGYGNPCARYVPWIRKSDGGTVGWYDTRTGVMYKEIPSEPRAN